MTRLPIEQSPTFGEDTPNLMTDEYVPRQAANMLSSIFIDMEIL